MASDVLATTLLACAVALATTLAVHVALQKQSSERLAQSTSNSLPAHDVPESLRVDAFITPENQAAFAHNGVFRGCTNVFAVLDAIHDYALQFLAESEWANVSDASVHITVLKPSAAKRGPDGRCLNESDDDDNDDGVRHAQWKLPECVDPSNSTEIVLFPGVNPLTFAPDKIINLSPSGSPTGNPGKKQVVVLPGALVLGGTFDVSDGSVYLGRNVRVEPNVFIKGPAILGDGSTLRSGAYIRGDVVTGQGVVLRGELKNALVLDRAELGHPGYCGDSICGFQSHFGNQVTTANLNLFAGAASGNLTVDVGGKRYDTGRTKVGVVLGDWSQLGCSAVTDPCTLVLPNTIVYPLSRLRKGVYGPNEVIKNKPMERGVLEIAPLRRTRS